MDEKETPVVQLNTAPGEINAEKEQPQELQPAPVEVNPETGKPYTQNEIVLGMINKFCKENNLQMRNVADSIAQLFQKQMKLHDKQIGVFRKAKEEHIAQVEFKELLAREIVAQRTIDNHAREIDKNMKEYVEAVVNNLVLMAKTPDQKEVAEKVAEMSGYKIGDLLKANEAAINEKAREISKKDINEWLIKLEVFLGEKQYNKFIDGR